MRETVAEVEVRLLATMPKESPIDLRAHAHSIARVVIEARKQQIAITRERVAVTRTHSKNMTRVIRALRVRMRDREQAAV